MKVSVITTAYNHEKTLPRAIRSVRAQRGVEIEHIIIDDTHTKNGMMKTFQKAFKRCTGDYIALCDGDDWFYDDTALKKQVNYMEVDKGCGLCLTLVYILDGTLKEMPVGAKQVNENMSFDALLRGKAHIHAQSYLIRKSDFDKYIDFDKFVDKGFNVWDYPIVLELIRHTRFHCLDFYGSVFNKNEESVTQTRSRRRRFKYVLGNYKIKLYYIFKYGCKISTSWYLIYKFARDIASIVLKRWYK